ERRDPDCRHRADSPRPAAYARRAWSERRAQQAPRHGGNRHHGGAGAGVALPAALGAAQQLPQLRLHPGQRLPVLRRVDAGQLPAGLGARQLREVLHQLALHHGPGGRAHALPGLTGRLRARTVQLPVQPRVPRLLPRRQPAAAPGAAGPGVPDVPGDPAADVDERLRLDAEQLLGADPRQHRVPARVLRVRAEQLHEDHPAGDLRVRGAGRRRRAPAVLAAHHAAGPSGAGCPRHARGHLDLQRVLLGDGPHPGLRQAADHQRAQQPPRPVLHRHQPCRRRVRARGAAGPHRLLRAAEAVRLRTDPRRHEGL
ncbi:MAG: ABC transporter, permease protein 2 (cluster 1, maltose/g3p/polyamine/iron), partial [uncultured Nocardioidaceae bacterium]